MGLDGLFNGILGEDIEDLFAGKYASTLANCDSFFTSKTDTLTIFALLFFGQQPEASFGLLIQ